MTAALLCLLVGAAPPAAATSDDVQNALSLLSGARQVDAAGEPSHDNSAEPLIDGLPDRGWEPGKDQAHQAVFQLAEPYDLSSAEVLNSTNEEGWPGLSVKQLKLEAGAGPEGPWRLLGELKLERKVAAQRFKIDGRAVRYVRVSLVTNHGNPDWFGIGELSLFGRRSEQRTVDFSGVWDTGYGELRLMQAGQRITGCYGSVGSKAGNSTVDGTLEGRTFAGTWREVSSDAAAPSSGGLMVFSLTREGGLAGVWGHGTDPKDRTGRWDGTRKGEATITCEPPERSLGKELAATGRVVLRGILFDTGKDAIRPESEPVLKALSAAMKADSAKAYLIEGHTDDRGGTAFNQALSERRAASVKAWLETAGVKAKLKPLGYGLTRPTSPNTTDGGRAANRRVEVAIEP
jgi:outer membrane protein OmpA-like peptidoglycan-associated protein